MAAHRDQPLLRCHFCGNQLSQAQALELHEGQGHFYVCEHCAISLDPLKLKESSCYRCDSDGKRNRSVVSCDMCHKGICAAHHVDLQPGPAQGLANRVSKYEPALMIQGSKRRVLCDVCATALGEEEDG